MNIMNFIEHTRSKRSKTGHVSEEKIKAAFVCKMLRQSDKRTHTHDDVMQELGNRQVTLDKEREKERER